MGSVFIDGNEAIARAAVDAGCKFFAGYPITPATSIYHHMLEFLPPIGGVCMQGEDEIASIGFCLGAAVGGAKVMTATSGPGISLFSEQISFSIAAQLPIVIVDVQRLGPSTGSATKGADGDIQFLRWGNSGGLPVIVLSPENVAECYRMTIRAFHLAEKYRCPVFLASNKEVGVTRESVAIESLKINDEPTENKSKSSEVERLFRVTSSTHGPDNYLTTDLQIIKEAICHLETKFNSTGDELADLEYDGGAEDELLLITYGVTSRAAREAVRRLREAGQRVALLVLKTLFPVPEKELKAIIKDKNRVLVIEMNRGQYVNEISRVSGSTPVTFLGKMNGELIRPEEITGEVNG